MSTVTPFTETDERSSLLLGALMVRGYDAVAIPFWAVMLTVKRLEPGTSGREPDTSPPPDKSLTLTIAWGCSVIMEMGMVEALESNV
jgi:hypothetical protein